MKTNVVMTVHPSPLVATQLITQDLCATDGETHPSLRCSLFMPTETQIEKQAAFLCCLIWMDCQCFIFYDLKEGCKMS